MKIQKPGYGLDFLTVIWLAYALLIFWLIPDWRYSMFGVLLACGALSVMGIWINFRPAGYLFACSNIISSILAAMVSLGYFIPDRPFTWRSILTIAVPLYCAWAGMRWAMGRDTERSLENADIAG